MVWSTTLRRMAWWVVVVSSVLTASHLPVVVVPPTVASPMVVVVPTIDTTRPLPTIPPPPKPPTAADVCLAQNLFFEANLEPTVGLQAVAATVFHRVASSMWPNRICAVVYQPYQYSWTLIPANWAKRPPQQFLEMARSYIANRDILMDMYRVTHFHRIDLNPSWASSLSFVGTFGSHHFYGAG